MDKQSSPRVLWSNRWSLPNSFFEEASPVVTVTAPAGYGKSTLISAWRKEASERNVEVVWLTVAEDDRDGDRLMIDLLHAFQPANAQRSQMLLGGAGIKGKKAVIMASLAEVASRERCTVLFIDDIHWLADSATEPILRLLVANQPHKMAIVLAGRTQSNALVSEAMLEGRLTRFTATQLAFQQAEVADLLRQHNVEPRPHLTQAIVERTHGWPAVVRLVAMTLQEDVRHQDRFLESLVDRRQPLAEYLSDVLLARLPDRSAKFLLRISILRRFSVSLAAAATNMPDAQSLLDELERRALPFTSSDDATLHYMLHPLVRDFLLARLSREDPEGKEESGRRALEWMTANGRVDVAIDLSLDIGDIDGAAALIDRYARLEARHYGRHSTFLYWCNKLPVENLYRFPKIQCIRVWSLNVTRRYSEADAILNSLDERLGGSDKTLLRQAANQAERDYVARTVELERIIQLTLRDQWVGLAPKARSWIARWPQDDKLDLGIAHVIIGCGLISGSDFDEALVNLRLGQRYWREVNAYYVAAWADMWAATALAKQGHLRQALYQCDEAVSEVSAHLGGQTPAEIMLHSIRAFLLYELNRLDEAGAALEHGLTALVEQCSVDSMIMGYVALARLQNAQGSQMDALETLAEGEVLGWAHNLPRLAIGLAAERIDMLMRNGELNQALMLWSELQRSASVRATRDFDNTLQDKASRIEARSALLRGDPSLALDLIQPALKRAVATRQKRKQAELLLLKAIAMSKVSGATPAFGVLQSAIDVAMSEGYVRMFTDEGAKAKTLLADYVLHQSGEPSSAAAVAYLQQISNAFNSGTHSSPNQNANLTTEVLTPRELKILVKLQSGLSNRELANALFVTEGTLKWHLRNIYGKLGVPNRLSAVSMARETGLIPAGSHIAAVRT